MIVTRSFILVLVAASVLSGCVAQELKMPWSASSQEPAAAPVVEKAMTTQIDSKTDSATPKVAPPVTKPPMEAVSSAAETASAAKTSIVETPPETTSTSPVVVPATVTPSVQPVSVPTPTLSEAPVEGPVVDTSAPAAVPEAPTDPMAEMRMQARAAQAGGESEVAEALWQLIQQAQPEDAEAKEALTALEQAKLNEAKAQGRVILLGEEAAGWVVQVATYRANGREQAFEWLGKIRRSGYKPFLKTVEFPGRTLYRLRLGAYPERWMAEEVERRLLNNFPNDGLRPRIMRQDD
jgi:hypothetical protein